MHNKMDNITNAVKKIRPTLQSRTSHELQQADTSLGPERQTLKDKGRKNYLKI